MGSIVGQVVDEQTRQPISAVRLRVGSMWEAITDQRGAFRFPEVPAGTLTLTVSHAAYGSKSLEVVVAAAMATVVRITLSETAIALEPLTVEVLSTAELRARGAGFQRNVIGREAISRAENTHMRLADVLRSHVPSVRVRRLERIVGAAPCIELRTIRATLASECLSPAVYFDGVPITNPMSLYDNLDLSMIESLEVIPANEAAIRYGTGALFGALLIETRRPGRIADGELTAGRPVRVVNFDWQLDPPGHSTIRVLGLTAAGNALGLAAGVAIARQCLGLRKPSNDGLVSDCGVAPTLAAGAAALLLPAIASGISARLAGQTERSRGQLAPAAVGAAMALFPGYALVFAGARNNSDPLQNVGYGILAIGAPMVTTIADYLFRRVRE